MNLSPEQFERRFAPYGCRKRADLGAGFELWATGWDVPFTIRPLPSNGYYDQKDCNDFALVIASTIPLEWRTAIEVSKLQEAIERLTKEIQKLRGELRGSRSGS